MKYLILIVGLLFCTPLFSQQNDLKNDIIMTTDGQLLQVKVTKVAEDMVTFNYPGESGINEIKRGSIEKIVFASGRTQNFNGSAATANGSPTEAPVALEETLKEPPYKENTLAIVPVKFESNGASDKTQASAATDFIVDLISQRAGTGINVLPMEKAIEKLISAGMNYEGLRKSSPSQLRDILGTEYIMYVVIAEDEKDSTATTTTKADFMAGTSTSGNHTQMGRAINLKVYGADSEVEAYAQDFSEQVFIRKTGDNLGSPPATDNWKASLGYLTDQLFASNVFTAK